eukprot:CAMPEP_0185288408 /NCGR_PEP_ID=MMETSP1363-20130426/3382_1 /TAXON_ID=38817 /ORGANISM="Gephyrocapsa oceanica, Strain RCC1303" /LENGTH=66 /DNA_ID=CAMNT_0027884281 /DNA_START=43 /DNA_END=243 /DNA_ORIENTATION=-
MTQGTHKNPDRGRIRGHVAEWESPERCEIHVQVRRARAGERQDRGGCAAAPRRLVARGQLVYWAER